MASHNSTSHVRRAQIVSLSLTELMLLLVFMAIAFSFLAKKEGLREVPRIQAQLNDALKENEWLSRANNDLETKLAVAEQDRDRLKRFLDRINIDSATLKPKGDTITIDSKHTYVLSKTAGQAPGHPMCTLKGGFLLNLSLLDGDRIQASPLWDSASDSGVASTPGLATLASSQPLSLAQFETAAKSVFTTTLASNGCVFPVKAVRQTNDADAFDAEMILISRFFYVSHH